MEPGPPRPTGTCREMSRTQRRFAQTREVQTLGKRSRDTRCGPAGGTEGAGETTQVTTGSVEDMRELKDRGTEKIGEVEDRA